MPIKNVARIGDTCTCGAHGSAPAGALSGRGNVRVNSQAAHILGDCRVCAGAPNHVIGGAATVRINGKQVRRKAEPALEHGALMAMGSGNVMVGGPTVLGDLMKWISECKGCAASRADPFQHGLTPDFYDEQARLDRVDPLRSPRVPPLVPSEVQSRGNCGPESARLLIRGLTDSKVNERTLYQWAENHNYLDQTPSQQQQCKVDNNRCGATETAQVVDILKGNGVDASTIPLDRDDLHQDVVDVMQHGIDNVARQGKPVIVPLFGDYSGGASTHPKDRLHWATVVGVELGEDGQITAYYMVDSGGDGPGCGMRVDASALKRGLSDHGMPITIR